MTISDKLVVSPSRLGTFDRCEFKYHLSYEEGWKAKAEVGPLGLGKMIHRFMAVGYSTRLTLDLPCFKTEPVLEAIREDLAAVLVDTSDFDNLQQVQRAAKIVLRYFEDYAPLKDRHWKPVAVEQHFQVTLLDENGVPYDEQGIVDLFMLNTKNNSLYGWDHKSCGGTQRFWTPEQVEADTQLGNYALIMRELGYPVKGICYNMLNTYEYKNPQDDLDKLFKREFSHRTDTELFNLTKNNGQAVADMRALENKPYRRRSLNKDCTWCHFYDPCIMSMKGVDPLPILQNNFAKESDAESTEESSQENPRIL